MSIGKNIQTLRKQNNMSQDQLAQKCNVSRQTISRWECDEVLPDTNNLITLSKLFNKSLDEIVFDKKNETNEKPTKKFYKPLLIIVLIISLLINSITFINYLSTKKNSIYGTWTYQEDGFDITLIIKETEEQTKQMVEEHEITQKAYEQANEIIEAAQKNAREIRLGARQYVENILSSLETRLSGQLEEIQAGREELRK